MKKSIASQPFVCVQFWVPSPLDYVQSSLSYWNQNKLKRGVWGGVVAVHGVGDLSQTVCKKGNCINLIEELLRMRASRFYASVLLVLLPSAVFLALITCPPLLSKRHEPRPCSHIAAALRFGSELMFSGSSSRRTEGSVETNRESPPPRPTAPHEMGPLLLAWRLYFHVREHLSPWRVYEALHSCLRGSNTHLLSLWFRPLPLTSPSPL